MVTTLRRSPLTLLERHGRGWMQGLVKGVGPDITDVLDWTARQDNRANGARCLACGRVGLAWHAYSDGRFTRVFLECGRCRHSTEGFGK